MSVSAKRDDQLMAVMAVLWTLGSMAMLGPVGLTAATIVFFGALLFGLHVIGGIIISAAGAGLGFALWRSQGWFTEPLHAMAEIYRDYLFAGFRWDTEGLFQLFSQMIWHRPAWWFFAPLGIAAGGLYWTAWTLFTKSPLKQVAHGRAASKRSISLRARINRFFANRRPAAIDGGSLIGVDQTNGKPVHLTDADAKQHTLVLGTIGSGKTVAILNVVESAIQRQLPMVYVDGKGDYALAQRVISYATARGRPTHLFAMNGDSCLYNPLADGGFSSKKDRIIGLREWSEDHYLKLAEGYMQTVFKVLDACNVHTDLVSASGYMSTARLEKLIKGHKPRLDNHKELLSEVSDQKQAEKEDIESLRGELRTLARSEIGHLFDTANAGPDRQVLELLRAVEERAVVYFCLPALQFPAFAKTLGKLVINDLKATAADRLPKDERSQVPLYTVFDEFSVFAGDQVLNLINMGRSVGVRAVLATQSVADIGRAVADSPDHFTRQVFGSCNSYVIHRLNAAEDAMSVVDTIGTEDRIEHTAQVDHIGSTGLGSVRRTKGFIIHADTIKNQPMGQAVFVNKNRGNCVQRILVRKGEIG